DKCALACEYYAEHAEAMLAPQPRETDAARSYVRFDPLGPVLAVMPWNFPFWQVFRFAAPALMAGNAGILKHASNVPRTALAIQEVFREAGFPRGLFSTVLISSTAVARLIADPRIVAATLTGSDLAGRKVAEQAGRELKKTVLELGGSDPFVVLADADLAAAARAAADARLVNSGQSCIAAKRFIVVEPVADAFVERFVRELGSRRVGDPLDRATQVGPLARADLREALHRQVQESVKRGAKLLLGGAIPDGQGAFYPPTLLAAVESGMPAFGGGGGGGAGGARGCGGGRGGGGGGGAPGLGGGARGGGGSGRAGVPRGGEGGWGVGAPHGFAGARGAVGGYGGPFRGPPFT